MGKPYKYTRNEQTGGYNENNWIHRNGKYGRSNRCRNYTERLNEERGSFCICTTL